MGGEKRSSDYSYWKNNLWATNRNCIILVVFRDMDRFLVIIQINNKEERQKKGRKSERKGEERGITF